MKQPTARCSVCGKNFPVTILEGGDGTAYKIAKHKKCLTYCKGVKILIDAKDVNFDNAVLKGWRPDEK